MEFTEQELAGKTVTELRQIARQEGKGGVEIISKGFTREMLIKRILGESFTPKETAKETQAVMDAKDGAIVEKSASTPKGKRGKKSAAPTSEHPVEMRSIKTKLVDREEMFRIFALGESLRLPVLLIGAAGIAKSQALTDYADAADFKNRFSTELDIGTKPSEIKGYLDVKKFMEENVYETISPIAEADAILINEVDKGSPEIKDTMLGVMRERELQLGSEGVKKCKWKLFAGTCNVLPDEERSLPFWDRFPIKQTMTRISVERIPEMWDDKETIFKVPILNGSIEDIPFDRQLLADAAKIFASEASDRTLRQLPNLVRGVKAIWSMGDLQAIMRISVWIAPQSTSQISTLVPKEYLDAMQKIEFAKAAAARSAALDYKRHAERILNTWDVDPKYSSLFESARNEIKALANYIENQKY